MTYLILSAFLILLSGRLFLNGVSIDNFVPEPYDDRWIIRGQEIDGRDPKQRLRKTTYAFTLGSICPGRELNKRLFC
jgi:hypothetical protein